MYIRCQSASTWRASWPTSSGLNRSVMMRACMRGAAGAWHSPQPTSPWFVVTLTSVACSVPAKRDGLA